MIMHGENLEDCSSVSLRMLVPGMEGVETSWHGIGMEGLETSWHGIGVEGLARSWHGIGMEGLPRRSPMPCAATALGHTSA